MRQSNEREELEKVKRILGGEHTTTISAMDNLVRHNGRSGKAGRARRPCLGRRSRSYSGDKYVLLSLRIHPPTLTARVEDQSAKLSITSTLGLTLDIFSDWQDELIFF
jgi:hypothetical protein